VRADFVNEVARILGIERRDLVEKDLILHQTLADLSKDKLFGGNFAFKGGTCLIKDYLGYFRFSEDIDFTWKDQGRFAGMSQKKVRSHLSSVVDETASVFAGIAARRGFDFKPTKSESKYVEFGGGNKMTTLKVWYDSDVLKRQSFFKVQINFVELLCFPLRRARLGSLLTERHTELDRLFPEYSEYAAKIGFTAYSPKEILSEKVRAILTRTGMKARDFVDVYFIKERLGIGPQDVEDFILKKLAFTLAL